MSRRTPVFTTVLAVLGGLLVWFGQVPATAADQDCGDFATQAAAQSFFLNNGGPSSDPHALDADGDGIACESNPCPCAYGTQLPGDGSGGSGAGGGKEVLRQDARIVRVIDGDTVEVLLLPAGPRRTVRLLGIDTPEVYPTAECGGPKATAAMKNMLPRGTRVRLVSDPTQDYKDRYGRLLRYVIKASTGRDVSRAQVWLGWASVYVYQSNPFQRVSSYRSAQAEAKAAPRGIWRYC